MQPDGLAGNYYYGGGATETFVTPIVLAILLLACVLLLLLPRKYALVPFFVAGLLVPVGQVFVVAGVHLMIFRILILFAWIRIFWCAILTKRDPFPSPMNVLDKVFALWALCNAVTYMLLWGEVGAVVNRLGFLYVSLGVYFLLRYFLRDRADVIRTIKIFAFIAVLIAIALSIEHHNGINEVYLVLGIGRRSAEVRNGSFRAAGPFQHSIIAGTFGAMLLPLFVVLAREGGKNRLVAGLGILSSTAVTFASASSTPVMTFLAGITGLLLWPFRKSMRFFRWGLVLVLVLLQLVMQAPVWFLINRVSALTGGTGWHRSELIDQFVRHFGDWWLIGTRNNATWGLDMWDSINAYVNAGVEGGFITFVLFLSIFVYAYKRIGIARRLAENNRDDGFLIWALGAALFCNTVAFFGITYFDQSVTAWYSLLVMISVMTVPIAEPKLAQPDLDFPRTSADGVKVEIRQPRLSAQQFQARTCRPR